MTTESISVLLVEDDEQDAYLVKRMLLQIQEVDVDVRHVTATADALDCISQECPDAVLLDLGLPDSQGFDTVLRIRASFPAVPVVVLTGLDDETVGIQAIECGAQDFVSKEVVTCQMLFRAIRFAIARHKQTTSFKTQAHTDALTRLSNRRAFDAALTRTLAGWKRTKHAFSVMFLDIDNFKKVNDVYGHRAGDFVLTSLSEAITESLRESAFAARYGGEEFAVIFPDTHLYYAATAADRLLQDVRNMHIRFGDKHLQITASAGIAAMTWKDDAASLCDRADQALYAAKDAGRDQAYVHDGTHCQSVTSVTLTSAMK